MIIGLWIIYTDSKTAPDDFEQHMYLRELHYHSAKICIQISLHLRQSTFSGFGHVGGSLQ